ncbi:hypothetical protein [Umezawaea sp.]|uniref:hypothetical protein n=1 Tax=Umezawaea sp. TaxID=1955258 RepID=UPI002ED0E739
MKTITGLAAAAITAAFLVLPGTAAQGAPTSPRTAVEYDYYATYANRDLCEKAGKRYLNFLWRDYYCKWTGGGTFHDLYVWWNA